MLVWPKLQAVFQSILVTIFAMTYLNFSNLSLPVFTLIALYSISSWIDVVGLRVEVPFMINYVPEGWTFPSYISLTTQLANIGPLIYSIISKVQSGKTKATNNPGKRDIVLSFIIISIEIVSMFLISLFWNHPTSVYGKKHSVVLMVLLCCSGLCSCLSSLVFLPYMARYPAPYISAYYLGNGLSGIIPGFIGISQGLGEEPTCLNVTVFVNKSCSTSNCTDSSLQYKLIPQYPSPRFSVQVYLMVICFLLLISLISFYCLNYTRLRRHQVFQTNLSVIEEIVKNDNEKTRNNSINDLQTSMTKTFTTWNLSFCLIVFGITQATGYGCLPAIQPYLYLPYGSMIFNLSIRLSFICGSLGALSTLFIRQQSERIVMCVSLLGLLAFIYQFALALQSPHPILQHHVAGSILVVSY